jgi:hypothetical protein
LFNPATNIATKAAKTKVGAIKINFLNTAGLAQRTGGRRRWV